MTIAQIPTAYAVEDEETGARIVSDNMKTCYSLSITVKWLAWLDIIFSMLYAIGNMYFIIPLCIAIFGYLGAKNFNKNYIITYFSYIIIISAVRFYIFMKYFIELTHNDKESYEVEFILVTLCTLIELWIARIIYKFYKYMQILSHDEIVFLRIIQNIPQYHVILW